MTVLETLAEAMRYPAPGREAELRARLGTLAAPQGVDARKVKKALQTFVERVEQLELGAWEELYTRTFDLNPPSAPYLGYQAWGDKYQRGELLAELGRRQREAGLDGEGELADHLVPVLRYLAAVPEPLPRLTQIMTPALEKMRAGVQTLDGHSPYLPLLDAVIHCATAVTQGRGQAAAGAGVAQEEGIQLTLSCHPDLIRRES